MVYYYIYNHTDDILAFLQAENVTPYNCCINVTYDSKGAIYEIPNYCINDPCIYDISEATENKQKPSNKEIIVIIRKIIDEVKIKVSNYATVEQLKELIMKNLDKLKLAEIQQDKIRLFFGGKELVDKNEIWTYHIEDGSIVMMMVKIFE
jgi:hypothetical protein